MTPVLLVQGTWAWGRSDKVQWWQASSAFTSFLQLQNFVVLGGARPYTWTTNLDGLTWFKRKGKLHVNWEDAGGCLYAYLVPALPREGFNVENYVPIAERNIIAHSHAMQVVAYACQAGLKINRLITIGSPVREDMDAVYKAARPNIGKWLHVHSDRSDRMQWFGELFDGHLGIVREQPHADVNRLIANVSHSKLLNDPAAFDQWRVSGLCRFLES